MSDTDVDLSKIEQAFVIRPGDKVLLRFKDSMSPEFARRIKDAVDRELGLEAIIVSGCDQIAVYRD